MLIALPAKIIGTFVLAGFSGWAYREGGAASAHARWLRQAGVGIAVTACLMLWFGFNWWTLLCLGTSWAESTYFKKKGTDAKWYNWLLVGAVFALVPLPFVVADGSHWIGFAVRCGLIIPATALIGTFVGDANKSEIGRGVIQIITLPLFLIGA